MVMKWIDEGGIGLIPIELKMEVMNVCESHGGFVKAVGFAGTT